MTGSVLNLALKSVVRNDELDYVKHGVLRDTLVEVLGTQILFHWIGIIKLAKKHVLYNLVCASYPEIPTYRKKWAHRDRGKCFFLHIYYI